MSSPENAPKHSPFAGCLLVMISFSVMGFLGIFGIWSGLKMGDAIKEFTDLEPLEVPTTTVNPSSIQQVETQFKAFTQAQKTQQPGEIRLTREELNQVFSHYPENNELAKNFHLLSITPEELTAQISWPLNKKPFSKDRPHLNGKMTAKAALENGEIVLKISNITDHAGREIPQEFQENAFFKNYRIAIKYREYEPINTTLRGVTSISHENGALLFQHDPAQASAIVAATQKSEKPQLLGVAGFFGFVLVGIIILLKVYKKRKNLGPPA